MRQVPGRFLASRWINTLPSDIDDTECKCEHCGQWFVKTNLIVDWSPTRGMILVCKKCFEGRDE